MKIGKSEECKWGGVICEVSSVAQVIIREGEVYLYSTENARVALVNAAGQLSAQVAVKSLSALKA